MVDCEVSSRTFLASTQCIALIVAWLDSETSAIEGQHATKRSIMVNTARIVIAPSLESRNKDAPIASKLQHMSVVHRAHERKA